MLGVEMKRQAGTHHYPPVRVLLPHRFPADGIRHVQPMKKILRAGNTLAVVFILLATGGCNIYACKYNTRFVQVQGTATSASVGRVVVESMGFRQYDPEQPVSNSVSYLARGEGLSTAPTRLTLRDNRDMSRVVADLSMTTSSVSFTAASAFDVARADRNRIFELLDSGNGRLVLELANDASLVVPLTVSIREDWHRPTCS